MRKRAGPTESDAGTESEADTDSDPESESDTESDSASTTWRPQRRRGRGGRSRLLVSLRPEEAAEPVARGGHGRLVERAAHARELDRGIDLAEAAEGDREEPRAVVAVAAVALGDV